ncbi:MAG TPA: 4-hydroxy-3-methylbut-2-enyl diphosphate reductase [Vicinamibacteria bacterium]|nr:4-hydroxy-3-methylbut-2-enyl diphosphate reductase [Vicinamibacteria bacterium]
MSNGATQTKLYRKGLGLRDQVKEPLRKDYKGLIVDFAREHGFTLHAGEFTFRLAKEFGFCYGVDRAVEYAYEARSRFPDKRLFITGEIIHNPFVNRRLEEMGILFLSGPYGAASKFEAVTADDVVLLPAFGVSVEELDILKDKGAILVDTTCGSVMNVWKNVERYARAGFTSVVHGKHWHEETKATVSRATSPGGHYLVVRDMSETHTVCRHIEQGGDAKAFLEFFQAAVSPGFDPDTHLERIGLANQTTMLSSESLAIAEVLRASMMKRYGERDIESRFCSFDTICSATQERQDAVLELCAEGVDIMLVIGGYNSSNTTHLAEICSRHFPTFHIADSNRLRSRDLILHKPIHVSEEIEARDWLPDGPLKIGITAGASTPDVKVDESIERLLSFRGLTRASISAD